MPTLYEKNIARILMRRFPCGYGMALAAVVLLPVSLPAVDTNFHNAPDSTKEMKNPVEGQPQAIQAGKRLYARNCLSCHGRNAQGTGNVPSLVDGKLESVSSGEVFWFVTKGSKKNGMPSWAFLPAQQRWQIVTYVKSLGLSQTQDANPPAPPDVSTSKIKAPPPKAPYTDFRYEKP